MSKYTPGPWLLAKDEPTIVYSDNNTVVCVAESQNGLMEARANAQLIAAAPELLEVLKELYSFIRQTQCVEHTDNQYCGECERAYKAIAKAEGRA